VSNPQDNASSAFASALADRYVVRRELGRGGMATVYLVQDLKHDREVALKVLHEELAAALGPERFKREIRTTARLQHPHILPVLDSGEAAGRLWYTMPYVKGESLRERLRREVQLPVDAAIELTRQVAFALDYAHREGAIHRDLKPENILLADGQALLADFGVAKALDPVGEARLTESGIAVGTPAYMSPEQAAGGTVDLRSDIYALGSVLYEMLTGEPPFTGLTPQAVLAKRVLEPVPHVRTLRETVPQAVEQALTRALAKVPADRFGSAGEFARSLARSPTAEVTVAIPAPPRGRAGVRRLPGALAFAGVVLLLGGLLAWAWLARRHAPVVLDGDLLAVAPFDVLDPQLQLWHEGLVDLLARNLDGAGPLRTVSPTVVIRGWDGRADRASATALARRTGAGLTVYGALVPAGRDSVRLTASVVDAVRGEVVAETEAGGPRDHVDLLGDSLTLRLIGELGKSRPIGAARTTGLGTRSVSALRAFLRAEQYFRRTAWDSARVYYEQAVETDTSFALAYWRLGNVRGWQYTIGDSLGEVYILRAGALNHGLPPRESLLVAVDSVMSTLSEPESIDSSSRAHRERLFRMADQLATRYPTDPESWMALGEARQHFGHGQGASYETTLDAFDRAIRLDSAYAPAYIHPIQLAVTLDDRLAIQHYADRFFALDPSLEDASTIRRLSYVFNPTTTTAAVDRLIDNLPVEALDRLNVLIYLASDSNEISLRIYREFAGRRIPRGMSWADPGIRHALLAAALAFRGHLHEAYQSLAPIAGLMAWDTYLGLALAGVVPPDSAQAVFRDAFPSDARRLGGGDIRVVYPVPWWLARRDTSAIKRYAEQLKQVDKKGSGVDPYWRVATEAYLALARADTTKAIRGLQSLPNAIGQVWYERLTLARLLTAKGRDREAFAVLDAGFPWAYQALERVPWALERARLAERLDDNDTARYWYGYVVRVWKHADPDFMAPVREAQAALHRLSAEGVQ
jgi:eukaryotic-like serine/threonine-protein kinase